MVMKLCQHLECDKISTKYDNQHYCIKFRPLPWPKNLDFFQHFLKKKLYPRNMTSQIKSEDNGRDGKKRVFRGRLFLTQLYI